jgi:hypothetical protein
MPPKNTMGDFLPFAASQEMALHADPELGDIVLAMPYIKRWVCFFHASSVPPLAVASVGSELQPPALDRPGCDGDVLGASRRGTVTAAAVETNSATRGNNNFSVLCRIDTHINSFWALPAEQLSRFALYITRAHAHCVVYV